VENVFDIGDGVILAAAFTDADGAAINPTTVVCRVKNPAGTVTTPTVAHPATGSYTATFVTAVAGRHAYRWEGTGAATAAGERGFRVRDSEVI
jgi:hypothetical protein